MTITIRARMLNVLYNLSHPVFDMPHVRCASTFWHAPCRIRIQFLAHPLMLPARLQVVYVSPSAGDRRDLCNQRGPVLFE